jgi:hypothetical protein
MTLTHLSNADLLSQIDSLIGSERQLIARTVAVLAEIEQRRLHLELAHSSLFDFCVRRLGLSEGEAYRRITAARLSQRFPCRRLVTVFNSQAANRFATSSITPCA